MEPSIERLVEIGKELVAAGQVADYNTTKEYAKKVKALDIQMKRVKELKAKEARNQAR